MANNNNILIVIQNTSKIQQHIRYNPTMVWGGLNIRRPNLHIGEVERLFLKDTRQICQR